MEGIGVNMIQLINMPLVDDVLEEYGDSNQLRHLCENYGCEGIEAIWGGQACKFSVENSLIKGWHLGFYCDWLDFWNGNQEALKIKFGNEKYWKSFYGADSKEDLLKMLSEDLERAEKSGAEYVVFHISDVSIEEGYTYKWLHTDEEVVDKSAEIINLLLDGKNYKFKFLMENLHWAGFTFTNPRITKRLLQKVNYKNKGIILDIGHLLCTNLELRNESDAIEYINKMLDEHDILCRYIKGIHLHQSLSGLYVKENTGFLPELPKDYWEKFSVGYKHILNIDTHKPFTHKGIKDIIERIKPDYLVHELAAANRKEKERALKIQTGILL